MGRIEPLTEAERQNLRDKAKARLADGAKEKKVPVAGSPAPASGGGGDNPSGGSGGGPRGGGGAGGASNTRPTGGGPAGGGTAPKTSRKISKLEKTLDVVVDKDKFLNGLPALARIHLKAGNNLLKIWNFLPIPLKLEIEDMTAEESDLLASAIKPGMAQSLPNLGKNHPIGTMFYSLGVMALAKVKATFSWKPKPPKELKVVTTEKIDEPPQGE